MLYDSKQCKFGTVLLNHYSRWNYEWFIIYSLNQKNNLQG